MKYGDTCYLISCGKIDIHKLSETAPVEQMVFVSRIYPYGFHPEAEFDYREVYSIGLKQA